MCGFTGIWRPPGAPDVQEAVIRAQAPRLRHRGPDQQGVVVRGRFALAAARLRVRGGDEGNQPLCDVQSGLLLAFNGEVLDERAGDGQRADSAFLLDEARRAGAHAVAAALRGGMGAFALFDERAQRLTLGRDAAGIKPLYYARTAEGGVAFSSEIAPLFVWVPTLRTLDRRGFSELITWHRPRQHLPFAGLEQVRGGTTVTFGFGSRAELQVREETTPAPRSLEARPPSAQELWDAIEDAARRACAHTGPASLLLSGGLDSAAVLAGAGRRDLLAVTGRFAPVGGDLDESQGAAAVAQSLGVSHEVVEIADADIVHSLPAVARALEIPLAGPGALSLWCLAPQLAAHGKVTLSGTGGDEWLGGYVRTALALGYQGRWTQGYEALAARLAGSGSEPGARLRCVFDRSAALRPLLDPAFLAELPEPDPPALQAGEGLAQALLREERDGTLASLLHVEDRVLMAHGVEGRPVLCLGALPHLACRLAPDALVGPDGEGKRILREALRGRVPEAVRIDPRKRGFPTPFPRAARGAGRAHVQAWLEDGRFARRGWWNLAACRQLLDAQRPSHDRALYSLLLIEWWARHFLDADPA